MTAPSYLGVGAFGKPGAVQADYTLKSKPHWSHKWGPLHMTYLYHADQRTSLRPSQP
ncbi:hypothetical protein GGD83_004091 [Rhodoblastus sphagnicola]|nr:hypothetical protein [Rhodoblastus sphagnicola]